MQEHEKVAAQATGPIQQVRMRQNKSVTKRNLNEELIIPSKHETYKANVMCPPYTTEFRSANPEEENIRKHKKPIEGETICQALTFAYLTP